MNSRRIPKRIKQFLATLGLQAQLFKHLKDPRRAKGKQWSFELLVYLFFTGALLQCASLAELERLSESIGERLPDSTLAYTLERINPAPIRKVLRDGVRSMLRSKTLTPKTLPFGVIAIDGKTSWVGGHQGDREAQKQDGRYNLRWMRAVLTSAPSRPCIDQDVIPAATNEMGYFATFWDAMMRAYSRTNLFRLVTLDAGYSSKENARIIDDSGVGYVLRIKGEQPTLLQELKRVLTPTRAPDATSKWESNKGRQEQRRLFRSNEVADYDGWTHLRQGWLVQTVVRHKNMCEEVVMERYFISNMLWNSLNPAQILLVVRGHWAIENDCNWTMDVVWKEDTTAWATNAKENPRHQPLRTLSWLRLLAYNVLGWLRSVRLRSRPKWSALRLVLYRLLCPLPTALEKELALAPLG